MAYKPILKEYCRRRNRDLLEEKDIVLLAKKDNYFYRVEEHIAMITKIYPKYLYGNDVPALEVMFAGRQRCTIRAYVDPKIQEYDFVSIYGIFTKNAITGNLEFYCKGGMVKIYENIPTSKDVKLEYVHRVGFAELSRPKESEKYPLSLEGIEDLETNNLWTYSSKNIRNII